MNKKIFINLILFLPLITICEQQITTYISPKSQAVDDARELVGMFHLYMPKKQNGITSSVTTQIAKSFRPERIIQCLFGDAVTEHDNTITISGNRTTGRSIQHDWLADYFGLATDFKSTASFKPRVLNYTALLWTHINFDRLYPGVFFELSLPITHTNWNMNISETISSSGTLGYDAGYRSGTTVTQENLLSSFSSFISGKDVPTLEGVQFLPLQYGKISSDALTTTRASELRGYLGIHSDQNCFFWHTGIIGGIALGTRPNAEYLFTPVVGNGHHHELGFRGHIHTTLWESNDYCEQFLFTTQATVTHLFSTKQQRTFDFKEKPNSRYMLAQQLTSTISNNVSTAQGPAQTQFNNILSSVINFTTFDITVHIPYQMELTFLCSYIQQDKCAWEFGYSLYKRAHDQYNIVSKRNFNANTWALVGDNSLFGFIGQNATALNATQSSATIYTGTNYPSEGISTDQTTAQMQIESARANNSSDNASFALANNIPLVDGVDANPINTSSPAIVITFDDIDLKSAQTTGLVQKIFAHVSQRFPACAYGPEYFIGLGAEVDFASQPGSFNDGANCPFSFWSVWVKVGIVF